MSGVSGERKSAAAAVAEREAEADEDEDESDEVGEAHGSPAREAEAAVAAADAAAVAEAEAEAAADLYLCALTADACDIATRFAECALAAEVALTLPPASVAALALPAVASAEEAVSSACV